MPIDPSNAGKTYPACPPRRIPAEEVAAFAASLGAHSEAVPLTYAMVLAQPALEQFFSDPALGIALERTVHADQSFEYSRPLHVGDEVSVALRIETVRARGTSDWVGIQVGVDDAAGRLVTARSTFIIAHATEPEQETAAWN